MGSFLRGFIYALRGVAQAVRRERNLRFDLCMAVYVYLFSLFYPFTAVHYAILTTLVFGVLAMEMFNTAVESIVDGLAPDYSPLAGGVKDISAGAVLVFCIGAAFCGVWLFGDPDVLSAIFFYFTARPFMLALLGVSLAASVWWVGFTGRTKPRPARAADEEHEEKNL